MAKINFYCMRENTVFPYGNIVIATSYFAVLCKYFKYKLTPACSKRMKDEEQRRASVGGLLTVSPHRSPTNVTKYHWGLCKYSKNKLTPACSKRRKTRRRGVKARGLLSVNPELERRLQHSIAVLLCKRGGIICFCQNNP